MRHYDPFPLGRFEIDWKAFGLMVNKMRSENGMTVRDVEALTKISYATISRVERGYSVEPDHFFTLLQFIGIPLDLPEEIVKAA
jgi:transcriptional regulator with XRE-family HTH domain